jgi:hypothetical protein
MGLMGFYFNHVTPTYLLTTLNPSYNTSRSITPETRMLLDMTTGCYAQNWFLQIVLPRARPHDLGLWRIWQGSLLVVDCVFLGAIVRNLAVLGVLGSPGSWTAEQGGNLAVMCCLIAVRAAFVVGVGFGGREGAKKKE